MEKNIMKPNEPKTGKKPFVIPELTVHGDVEVITLGKTTVFPFTDRVFPNRTPIANQTYSQ